MFLYEVEEVLKYLADHPTSAEIEALVYEVKPRHRKLPTEDEFHRQFNNVIYDSKEGIANSECVEHMSNLPEELRSKLKWAEELQAKYRKAIN